MNIVKEWFETHRGLFRSDIGLARQERREIRHINRDIKKEHQVLTRIDAAFTDGHHEKIKTAFKLYFNAMEKELHDLMAVIADYKSLMRRGLVELDELVVAIKRNPDEPEKDVLIKNVKEMSSQLQDNYNNFFRSMAGFEDRNLSASQILDEASLVKDAFYQAVQLRKAIRGFTKVYKSILIEQQSSKKVNEKTKAKEWRDLQGYFKNELERHKKELVDIFQLLYDFQKHLDKLHEEVQQLRNVEGYPEGWMKENYEILDKLRNELKQYVKRETEQARLFMSKEERLAA